MSALLFFFFRRIASALYVKPFVWSGCGCLMLESVFVFFFFPLLFGSLRPACIWDNDEKGRRQNVASFYLKALSVSWGFFASVLSARCKSGCVKFAVPTLQNWQKSILLETSGPRAPSSCRLYFSCYVFLIWMKESYWCGSHWAFSHSRGYYTCFHISLMPVDVSGGLCCHSLFMKLDDMFLWTGLLICGS